MGACFNQRCINSFDEGHLENVYEKLVESTSKYLLICEYYNPTPVNISYRGNENKLFKKILQENY